MHFARFRGPGPAPPPLLADRSAFKFVRKRTTHRADNERSMPRPLFRRPDGPWSTLPSAARPALVLLLAAALLAPLSGCGKGTPVSPHIAPIASLVIQPRVDTLRVGEDQVFRAAARDSAGVLVTARLVWTSRDTGVFVVDPAGRVTGHGEGTAFLVARADSPLDSARVTVLPASDGWFRQVSNASV